MTHDIKVMIAGIGGASLGTEVLKSLQHAGGYDIYGCDVSPTAYGLYQAGFSKTYRVDRDHYIPSVIEACLDAGVSWLVAGGEQPMLLLRPVTDELLAHGICLVGNSPEVIELCADKHETFLCLGAHNIPIPRTVALHHPSDVETLGLPCIVKPATGTGGSFSVFFAVTADEAMVYADFIRRSGALPIAQEYIDVDEGEFTIGVLSTRDGKLLGSIALRRSLDAKLSIMYRGRGGVVSSGYSQGFIDDFPEICQQAERIAQAVDSRGPLNIQGRVRDGVLLPFEINPRFSASMYLRTLAGFNELDRLIRDWQTNIQLDPPRIRRGWYLRSLTEEYVSEEQLK